MVLFPSQCIDQDECEDQQACGPGAVCTNLPGGHRCECPVGFDGDPYTTGCSDADECARSPCGRNALCNNMPGSFRCACPQGYIGDPFHECIGELFTFILPINGFHLLNLLIIIINEHFEKLNIILNSC
jgi:hypothetical protein